LAIAPFPEACRALVELDLLRLEPVRLVEPLERDREFPDAPFLLVDLFVFERPLELALEDRVVCAIVIAFLGSCRVRDSHRRCDFVTRWDQDLNFAFRVSAEHGSTERSKEELGPDAPAQDQVQQ
jgi:hypothetical protein